MSKNFQRGMRAADAFDHIETVAQGPIIDEDGIEMYLRLCHQYALQKLWDQFLEKAKQEGYPLDQILWALNGAINEVFSDTPGVGNQIVDAASSVRDERLKHVEQCKCHR